MNDSQQPKRRLRKQVRVFLYSIPIMICISIMIFILGRPHKAVIINSDTRDQARLDIDTGVSTLNGTYFTLEYRTSLNSVSEISSQDANALEAYRIARSALEDRRILIVTIKKLPAGGITEESSYKLRQLDPALYKPTAETIDDMTFNVMSRTDNQEVVAFTARDGKLAVIAYSAGASDSIYHDAVETIKSFRWK